MLIKKISGTNDLAPYSIFQLKKDNPNVSFHEEIPDATLAIFDVYRVKPGEPPEFDPSTHRLEESGFEKRGGDFYLTYSVVEKSPEEIEERVPQEVSMRQARILLLRLGILSEVDAIIDQLGVGAEEARIEWEYSTTVSRDWPLIDAIASRLNMPPEEIDQLFIAAGSV